MEAGLEAVDYYDPPNLTFPFGSYICVVDIDRGTGEVKIRRFVAVDDCGNIINPMIVDGQIHGGLTMGMAPALFEEISYDENGNVQGGSFMDYLLPTAMETPKWETDKTVTPSPAPPVRREGGRRVGDGRSAAGDRQRGRGRPLAPGRQAHRHPDHPREGLEDPEREGSARKVALLAASSPSEKPIEARRMMGRGQSDGRGGARATAARWTVVAALLSSLAAGIASLGPIRRARPERVFSNTPDPVPPFFSDSYLGFLAAVRGLLPAGESVAVVTPDPSPESLGYFVALSQLPRQRLVTGESLSGEAPPRFVAAFGRPFSDPRYALLQEVHGGALYQRR